jgi:hypothetical protein
MTEPAPKTQIMHCIVAKLPGGNFWSDKYETAETMNHVLEWLRARQVADVLVFTDPLIVLEPTAESSNE